MDKLLDLFKKKLGLKTDKTNYFLCLQISNFQIKAAVFQTVNQQSTILNTSLTLLSGNELKDILLASSQAIGLLKIEEAISQQLSQVIFGLPEDYIDKNGKVKKEKLALLKSLCQQLELKPIGFVVNTESLAFFLRRLEGSPSNAILIGVEPHRLNLTLVSLGKILLNQSLLKEKSGQQQAQLISKVLNQFKNRDSLPPRILLYNHQADLENIRQELLRFPWLDKNNFLHFPKIEVLEEDFTIKAVAFAGSSELGVKMNVDIKSLSKETVKEKPILPSGFIEGDIRQLEERETAAITEEAIAKKETVSSPPAVSRKISFPSVQLPALSGLPLLMKLSSLAAKKLLIIGGVFLVSSLIILLYLYWQIPKAAVLILAEPEVLEQNLDLIVDPQAETIDINKEGKVKRIPGSLITNQQSGSKTAAASGQKLVGEKARGEIIIFNKTENSKTFSRGTVLRAENDLSFTLDEEITVASTSAFATAFASSKGRVLGANIGPEYNLDANTNFSFGDYPTSSYFARNEAAFSGGSSREIEIVTQEDREKLLNALTTELKTKAIVELKKQTPASEFLEEAITSKAIKQKFDKNVGEEADNLTLDLEIEFKLTAYQEADIKQLMERLVQDSIPEGFELNKEDIYSEIKVMEYNKDGSLALRGFFRVKLLPKLAVEKIRQEIAGKSPQAVEEYFRSLNHIVGLELNFKPRLPGFLRTLPRKAENITIKVEAYQPE